MQCRFLICSSVLFKCSYLLITSNLIIYQFIGYGDFNEENGCGDIVEWLVSHFFSLLNIKTKSYIVKEITRPRPDLISLKSSDCRQNRGFNIAWYNKCEWLTGSPKLKKKYFVSHVCVCGTYYSTPRDRDDARDYYAHDSSEQKEAVICIS